MGPAASERSSASLSDAQGGFRQLRNASLLGLLGQILIWGSVIALWVVGSLFSSIPPQTTLTYGAHGIVVRAADIFALNGVLIVGAAVALLSLLLTSRSFQRLSGAAPANGGDAAVELTTIGAIGFGIFALGWAIWLGSFVAPGSSAAGDSSAYVSTMDSNLAVVVDLLLFVGGLLAFVGMVGVAVGGSKAGSTYQQVAVDLGGALSILPVLSILGYGLTLVGVVRVQRKLRSGWVPPPPPPVPTYPSVTYPGGYQGGAPIVVSGQPGTWDTLAAVFVVLLVLLWVLIIPISFIVSSDSLTKGPGNPPRGGNASTPPSAAGPTSPAPLILLLGIVATAVLLPLVIVRNRRKRQRHGTPQAPTPPPPPPPPPPAREEDSLDHLV